MPFSLEKATEINALAKDLGVDATAEKLGLSRESVKRARRVVEQGTNSAAAPAMDVAEDRQYRQFLERFTQEERNAILNGRALRPTEAKPRISFDGEDVTIGFCTDTHMGAKHFIQGYWEAFLEECEKQNAGVILHGGDLIEGMSNRPDQVYGLSHIGYSAQMDYATEMLAMSNIPIKIIDGNHDRWGIKSGGIYAVKDIASRLDHVEFLGHDSGTVDINGTTWMLSHGEDAGGSYAISYRIQKMIEAFRGGDKPNVLLTGHDHKSLYHFTRNVHGVAGGALCTQSAWMKATRKENADGFWIIKAGIRDNEIRYFEPRWYPFY